MNFKMLGPAEIRHGDTGISVPGGIPGAILAILLIRQGRAASISQLIDMIWGDDPPPSARKTVCNHVRRLRDAFRDAGIPCPIETRGDAYVIPAEAGTFDVDLFEELTARGSEELLHGNPAAAAEILDRAMTLWRGWPFEDIKPLAPIIAEQPILEKMWLAAREDRFDAALRLAQHRKVLPDMERLAAAYPLRERLHGLLILALFRNDRQQEALAVYDRIHKALDDELGQRPGEGLRRMQQMILDVNGPAE